MFFIKVLINTALSLLIVSCSSNTSDKPSPTSSSSSSSSGSSSTSSSGMTGSSFTADNVDLAVSEALGSLSYLFTLPLNIDQIQVEELGEPLSSATFSCPGVSADIVFAQYIANESSDVSDEIIEKYGLCDKDDLTFVSSSERSCINEDFNTNQGSVRITSLQKEQESVSPGDIHVMEYNNCDLGVAYTGDPSGTIDVKYAYDGLQKLEIVAPAVIEASSRFPIKQLETKSEYKNLKVSIVGNDARSASVNIDGTASFSITGMETSSDVVMSTGELTIEQATNDNTASETVVLGASKLISVEDLASLMSTAEYSLTVNSSRFEGQTIDVETVKLLSSAIDPEDESIGPLNDGSIIITAEGGSVIWIKVLEENDIEISVDSDADGNNDFTKNIDQQELESLLLLN